MTTHTETPDTETPVRPYYTLWATFSRTGTHEVGAGAADLRAAADDLPESVTLRGFYDVSGLRADADLMVWLIGPDPQHLQAALRRLRRAEPLASMRPVWNALGVHRDAEFARNHEPAYLRGLPPKEWVTVYPFVRSYDWYVLPEDERRAMLAEHGRMGAEYRSVQTNTVASFALGDYEWILALEAAELTELVDLMRHLRATQARLHVREEVPFYTGRLIGLDEIAEVVS